jgi:hypothetical protein
LNLNQLLPKPQCIITSYMLPEEILWNETNLT